MNKNEKNIFTAIITVVIVFIVLSIAAAFVSMPILNADNSAKISMGEARALVLEYADLESEDVAFTKQEADIIQGVRRYSIEFNDGTTEYEYSVNAHTGEIISSSSKRID